MDCSSRLWECGIRLPRSRWVHVRFGDNLDLVEGPRCDRCAFGVAVFDLAQRHDRFRPGYDSGGFRGDLAEMAAKHGVALGSIDENDEMSIKELVTAIWGDKPRF